MQQIKLRQSLFWDTNPKKLDLQKNAKYIIERIMDFGNERDVKWMRKQYPKELLAQVSKSSRQLHTSSKTLWTLLTNQ